MCKMNMLPPMEPNLTPFRDSDSAFDIVNIAGFLKKDIFTIPLSLKSSTFFRMSISTYKVTGYRLLEASEKMEGRNSGRLPVAGGQ